MGVWGPGNFQNDAAGDLSIALYDQLRAEVEAFVSAEGVAGEEVDDVMAHVATILVLAQHCSGPVPDIAALTSWRQKVLRVFDEDRRESCDPEYRPARRAVLEQTFAELERLASD